MAVNRRRWQEALYRHVETLGRGWGSHGRRRVINRPPDSEGKVARFYQDQPPMSEPEEKQYRWLCHECRPIGTDILPTEIRDCDQCGGKVRHCVQFVRQKLRRPKTLWESGFRR